MARGTAHDFDTSPNDLTRPYGADFYHGEFANGRDDDDSSDLKYQPSKTLRELIDGRLREQSQCLDLLLQNHIWPLLRASDETALANDSGSELKKRPGDEYIDAKTVDQILKGAAMMSAHRLAPANKGTYAPLSGAPSSKPEEKSPHSDPLGRFDVLGAEIDALLMHANMSNKGSTRSLANDFAASQNTTSSRYRSLRKILGYKKSKHGPQAVQAPSQQGIPDAPPQQPPMSMPFAGVMPPASIGPPSELSSQMLPQQPTFLPQGGPAPQYQPGLPHDPTFGAPQQAMPPHGMDPQPFPMQEPQLFQQN